MTRTEITCIIVAFFFGLTLGHIAYGAMHDHNTARLDALEGGQ